MARIIQVHNTAPAGATIPTCDLPFHSHPLFQLRRLLIVTAAIGAFLCVLSWDAGYLNVFPGCAALLASSVLFALGDLTIYATKKVQHPDGDPAWPRPFFIAGDIFLALVEQYAFWIAISDIERQSSYYYGSRTLPAYGALALFTASLLHGYSFWKELMARYEKKWLVRVAMSPCPRCGYHDSPDAAPSEGTHQTCPPNTNTFVGPSAAFSTSAILTPSGHESAMEEGLLINPEPSSNYCTAGPSEPTISHAHETVVGKGKKKRIIEDDGKIGVE